MNLISLFLSFLIAGAANGYPTEPLTPTPAVQGAVAEVLPMEYQMVNDYRRYKGLIPLHYHSKLEQSACASAEAIVNGPRTWSHDGWANYIYLFFPPGPCYGENLAKNFDNFSEVVWAWDASYLHQINLTSTVCDFEYIGLCQYGPVWVAHFAE